MLHQTGYDQLIENIEPNNLLENIVESLLKACELYGFPNCHILLVIRNLEYTLSDHRLIEYELFEKAPKIKFFRLTLTQISQKAIIDDHKRLFM